MRRIASAALHSPIFTALHAHAIVAMQDTATVVSIDFEEPAMKAVIAVTALAVLSTIALAQEAALSTPSPPDSGALMIPLAERIKVADKNDDGALPKDEAAAGMPRVAQHFDTIESVQRATATPQN